MVPNPVSGIFQLEYHKEVCFLLFYSLFISDFKKPKNCEVSFYADDTGLMSSAKHTKTIINKLHSGLKSCNKFFRKWKIRLNASKTQAIVFPYNNSPKRKPTTQLIFGGEEIKFSKTATYLGFELDGKTTFGPHIKIAAEKSLKCFKSLYPLLARNSKLSLHNKNILYKSMIRPIMTYGCPVWHKAAFTHIKKLQVVQNKCLKLINKLPWRYSTTLLHQYTSYPMVTSHMQCISEKFHDSCAVSDYELIRELVAT